MAELRAFLLLVWRYGLAGALNTLVGVSIIGVLDLGLHAPPALANAAGYAVGTSVGFVLSRRFVFRSIASARTTAPRYLLTVLAGFCLNQLVLTAAGRTLGPGALQHLVAQLLAVTTYTGCVFLACRWWVFRRPIDPVVATV